MRPYQITATERILNRIEIANNYKKYGSVAGGGYIWHTTGSGKTLTSFKTARLASHLPYIDKVLFVVDRKDLDYQTMKEYDRFEKGAANSNTSTAILKKQLEDDKSRIIITTIQKLSTFVNKNKDHPVFNKHVVIIFDECHRSQFGDMHAAIVKNFKKYHLFGFTGTPIFATNTGSVRNPQFFTTEQTFGDQLHTYTIVDAINDKNVLPFRVDYIKTMDMDENMEDEDVWDINREKAFMAPQRIELVTRYILEHFDQKTYRGDKTYIFNTLTNIAEVASAGRSAVDEIKQKQRVSGFNSILAVASVPMAKLYYNEFKKQMEADPTKKLRIATIFSYGANEEETDGILDEENSEDTTRLDQSSRDFLDGAIKDYNEMFHVDEGKIKMRPAVEISYLDEDCQRDLVDEIDLNEATPSHDQTIRMRKMFDDGMLTPEAIKAIMSEQKPNQREKIVLRGDKVRGLIPKGIPLNQTEDYVCKALEYYAKFQRSRSSSRDSR